MPDPQLLPAFVFAVTALMLLPGPNVALIVANSLAGGPRRGMLTALATSSASVAQLLLVSAGMASVVARAGEWFGVLRWIGVAYLVALGIAQWRSPPVAPGLPVAQPLGGIFARAITVSLLNPKTLLFYAAFFPQFLDPSRPATPQLLSLAAIYLVLAIGIDCLWALLAARARALLGARSRLFNRLSGTVLIGAGLGLAAQRTS